MTLVGYMVLNSKYASAEEKLRTYEAIRAAGQKGISSAEVREITGLPQKNHLQIMTHLAQYGGIRKVAKRTDNTALWSVIY